MEHEKTKKYGYILQETCLKDLIHPDFISYQTLWYTEQGCSILQNKQDLQEIAEAPGFVPESQNVLYFG